MRLVLTLLARDEADIVDAQIAFHLHAGVDFVVATDNRSQDGTTEVLERYERAGLLHLIHEPGNDMRQDEWVTRMARLAATDFGADWVLNTDADEFWWPRGGSLREVLAGVPERFGVVRAAWRHFVPRPDDGRFFAERMIVRLREPAHPGEKETIFHAHQKVAHRADPDVHVERGNHNAYGARLEPLRSWLPIEVLHFSYRSHAQLARKVSSGAYAGFARDTVGPHKLVLQDAWTSGELAEHWREHVVEDRELERGLADGRYALDTRVRDALRLLRDDGGGFSLPSESRVLAFERPNPSADALLMAELDPLASIEGLVRAEERVAALEERLDRLEREPLPGLRRLARR